MANVAMQTLRGSVQSATGCGGPVQVTLDNGVATLFEHVTNLSKETKAKKAALSHPSVNRVIGLQTSGVQSRSSLNQTQPSEN